MKSINYNLLTTLIANKLALRNRNNNNKMYARKMWNPNYRSNNNRRKRRNWQNKGLEINKAIGGTKQVYNNSRVQFQTIEFYSQIVLPDPDYDYLFLVTNSPEYNLASQLNDNDEFLELRKRSIQYKVMSMAMSFNYNRVPAAQDKFSKMIVTPETDMVLQVEDPKINSNSMVWDMSTNGTKNYSFRFNNRNTEKINAEWQIAESQWNAVVKVKLSSQGTNYIHKIDGQTTNFVLGEVKFSFRIKYVQTDSPHDNLNRITNTDILNIMRLKFNQAILLNKAQNKMKQLEKQKNEIKQEMEKLNETITLNADSDLKLLEDID
jgi:hypothetical protein